MQESVLSGLTSLEMGKFLVTDENRELIYVCNFFYHQKIESLVLPLMACSRKLLLPNPDH